MDNERRKTLLRGLPSVDELLRLPELKEAVTIYSAPMVADAARIVLEGCRSSIIKDGIEDGIEAGIEAGIEDGALVPSAAALASLVLEEAARAVRPGMARVINATGIVLHTNIGRAILSPEAIEAVVLAAGGSVNLEMDISTGERGQRDARVERLVRRLTGAEAACVVNNNAAAVLIALNTLAQSREVVVSRGELIEIGGSFRLPEIISKSGCLLKEVGTTNRTHPADYEEAIGERTALLFKAHTSNYRVVGFTAGVPLKKLASIAAAHNIPVVEDLGSGSLVKIEGVAPPVVEPTVAQSLSAGASLVTFSGDKLLGGPQAGIIAGSAALVERIKKNPLKRALRADKLTLAALEATLLLYLNTDTVTRKVPTLRFLSRPFGDIDSAAQMAASLLRAALGPDYEVEVVDVESMAGAGSMPGQTIPSRGVSVTHGSLSPQKIYGIFLSASPAILGRISGDRFLLDMRAVREPADVVPRTGA
ncbi:MAG: L-seryl-tRNA(Sec) selenium transferase [Thermodesulfobacteriota bacterium]|nr:MAG: L-seryl-tRNA(Sec) selenium transferase [Thermodesulfobacteriota bacterium]